MTPQDRALRIIRGEHQTLSAVIFSLKQVADDMARGKLTPDYKLLWSIMYYIEEFPERLHHPKEELELFPRIRARGHDIDDTLDELHQQHLKSRLHLDALKALLGRMEAEIPGAAQEFCAKLATYQAFHYQHMSQEEAEVLPKARELLTAQDWEDIAASFAANDDPMLDNAANSSEWFREFFQRLVTLVPEPWGLGTRR